MLLPQKLSMRSDACDQFPREFHIYIIFNLWCTRAKIDQVVWRCSLNNARTMLLSWLNNFVKTSFVNNIVVTTCSRLMNEQWLLQHDGTCVDKVDGTCLITVVRTMLFSVVESSGVNNIV